MYSCIHSFILSTLLCDPASGLYLSLPLLHFIILLFSPLPLESALPSHLAQLAPSALECRRAMPPSSLYQSTHSHITTFLHKSQPRIPFTLGHTYAKTCFSKTKTCSHLSFLKLCLRRNIIPKGFALKHTPADLNNPHLIRTTNNLLQKCSRHMIATHISHLQSKIVSLNLLLSSTKRSLFLTCDPFSYRQLKDVVAQLNDHIYQDLQHTKTKKIDKLLTVRSQRNSDYRYPPIPQTPISPDTVQQHHDTPHSDTFPVPAVDPSPPVPSSENVRCIPSDLHLTAAERSVLSKGLNFIPTVPVIKKHDIINACNKFFTSLRWMAVLGHRPTNPSANSQDPFTRLFKKPSHRKPPHNIFPEVEHYIKKCSYLIQNTKLSSLTRFNLTEDEQLALRSLKSRDDIVIKPADKGGAVVVWRRDLYIEEAQAQLQNPSHYQPLNSHTVQTDTRHITKTIKNFIQKKELPPTAKLLNVKQPRHPCFYIIPKIHKPNNPGRPIVSACNCPTENISAYLDTILQPLVQSLPTFVKDSTHALNLIDAAKQGSHTPQYLFTLDVTSLYTSIPHTDGLKALAFFLNKRPSCDPPTQTLLCLAEKVLTLNSFSFNGQTFSQVSGVAMGTKMGPSYACLFMGYLEHHFFQQYTKPLPEFYKRYIDDCFGLTSLNSDQILDFIHAWNDFHPNIRFTHQISSNTVNFLDINVSLSHGNLQTSVHYKPTDAHTYLHYESFHNPSVKNNIPYSQFLRLRRLCSDEDDFRTKSNQMTHFFLARHYPQSLVHKAHHKALSVPRTESLQTKPKPTNNDRPILIMRHHPATRPIRSILLENWHLLQSTDDVASIYPKPPLIAYKRNPNLKDLLVHSKLQTSSPRTPGTRPCNDPNCRTCPFLSSVTSIQAPKMTFTISKSFTCQTHNLVYAINCTHCGKIYIGETGRTLDIRFQEHIADIRHARDRPVARHFNSAHHTTQHVRVRGLWLMPTPDEVERKLMETHLIRKLGTLAPLGLNEREE